MIKLMKNPYATHIDYFQFKGLITTNPKAHPCNIDMIFERKCKFLIGEWKRDNETMSKGQEILLKNLAKQPQFIVLIIYGNTDEETIINKFEMITSNGNFVEKGKSFDELKVFITKWYNWAEGKTNE
jgi:hypothetical protein